MRNTLAVSTLIALFASSGHAMAATESFSVLTDLTASGTGSVAKDVELTGFDPALGTLTGVSITLSDGFTFSSILSNHTPLDAPAFTVSGSASLTADVAGGVANLTASNTFKQSYAGLATGDTAAFHSGLLADTSANAVVDGLALLDFTGSTVDAVLTLSASKLTVPPEVALQQFTSDSDDLEVTYTYTPEPTEVSAVPEPTTNALFAVGLLGMTAMLRRSKRSAQAGAVERR